MKVHFDCKILFKIIMTLLFSTQVYTANSKNCYNLNRSIPYLLPKDTLANVFDKVRVEKVRLVLKKTKYCNIEIEYPQFSNKAKKIAINNINRQIKTFFEIEEYLKKNYAETLCPADVYNKYELRKHKNLLFLSNSVFTFNEGAQHSYQLTSTIIFDRTTSSILHNNNFFKEKSFNDLKDILLKKINSLYDSYGKPFDKDFYTKQLTHLNYFINGDKITFYIPNGGEGSLAQEEIEMNYNDISGYIKDEYK